MCLHGVAGSDADWTPAAQELGGRGRIVTDSSAAGQELVVVGHSQGGLRALELAALHAEHTTAVILTSSFFPPSRGGRSLAAAVADFARHRALYAGQTLARGRRPRPTRRAAGQLRSMAGYALHPARWHALAAEVSCPLLIIHGGRDHLVPVAFARAAAVAHPAWDYRELPGAGHFPHRDRPVEWVALVLAWLAAETGG